MNIAPHPSDPLEAAIVAALDDKPATAVPADFAARVAAQLPVLPAAPPATHFARNMGCGAVVLLLAVLFLLAPHAAPQFTNAVFDVELLLLAQLVAVTAWLVRREA